MKDDELRPILEKLPAEYANGVGTNFEGAIRGGDESNNCYRCGSILKNGLCTDVTCPYSDHPQSWDYETNSQ